MEIIENKPSSGLPRFSLVDGGEVTFLRDEERILTGAEALALIQAKKASKKL